jgi:hypothetical protein
VGDSEPLGTPNNAFYRYHQSVTTKDLSHLPTDWLKAFAVWVGEPDGTLPPEEVFTRRIEAIFRMRDIERREGRSFAANPDDALAELARR